MKAITIIIEVPDETADAQFTELLDGVPVENIISIDRETFTLRAKDDKKD